MGNYNNVPVEELYKNRSEFSIIGLTGYAGAGCSTFANITSKKNFIDEKINNRINTVMPSTSKDIKSYLEYKTCYNYITQNTNHDYKIIKYTHVVLLYTLINAYATELEPFKQNIETIVKKNFYPSKMVEGDGHTERENNEIRKNNLYIKQRGYQGYINVNLNDLNWNSIHKKIRESNLSIEQIYASTNPNTEIYKTLYEIFNSNEYQTFAKRFIDKLYKTDYYALCFLFHRLSILIRSYGDPSREYDIETIKEQGCENVYNVAKFINFLIKGAGKNEQRRFIIDSFRNSLETTYFKERYTAFYLIAVHKDEQQRENRILEKVAKSLEDAKEDVQNLMFECINIFIKHEQEIKEYEKGVFYSPDTCQCIADAEIHIWNEEEKEEEDTRVTFSSLKEQWMKYVSLIMHPGLIRPTEEERCMIVAYTAKFNSGCISRQVGACITNEYNSVRSIGWNEVASGQIPCALRDMKYLFDEKNKNNAETIFSDFERNQDNYYTDCNCFKKKLEEAYPEEKRTRIYQKGLPLPYCFKTEHNEFESCKNQVYTRSLHAEENAIIQMAKYGGEKLSNGIIYVTASPCELCSKKLFQIGVKKIVYIDPYPGIARNLIINCGDKKNRPELKVFTGVYGSAYFKLYSPFMSYKDEIKIRLNQN